MSRKNPIYDDVRISRILLDLTNPRHEEYETEAEAIDYLCKNEFILPLARDIVEEGLNPLERFALIPIGKPRAGGLATSYVSAEGNRRICAIKLLDDPELAPANMRKQFEELAEEWSDIKTVPAVIFKNKEDVRPWLDRLHAVEKGGIGRRRWSADQKARFTGAGRNRVALAVLDYAEEKGLITSAERKGKLTTAQRYLHNPLVRDAIGIDATDPDNITRCISPEDFRKTVGKFVDDLKSGAVTSRSRKEAYPVYARQLRSIKGLSGEQTFPEPIVNDLKPEVKSRTRHKPRHPGKRKHIQFEDEISKKLKELGNYKLSSLYYSICDISLIDHAPIITVGMWSFFESLSVCAGRNTDNSLESFFSNARLQNNYQLGSRNEVKPLREALARVAQNGNTTKHHGTAASYDGLQIANDMDTLRGVILKCIDEAIANKK